MVSLGLKMYWAGPSFLNIPKQAWEGLLEMLFFFFFLYLFIYLLLLYFFFIKDLLSF